MSKIEITFKDWDPETTVGYKPITTWFGDFSIAEPFGIKAIKDTYNSAVKSAKDFGYKYLTELVMVLNWKCWQHYDEGNIKLSELYSKLFYELRDYCFDNLKDDELSYFYDTID